jgi:hypothetical protein
LFKSGETGLNPLTAAKMEVEFEPDYLLDLIDIGSEIENNIISKMIKEKKSLNELRLNKFLQKALKLYSKDQDVYDNYLKFKNICDYGKNEFEVYSDSEKYQEKMNYYSRTKNDLESFLINKLKKEG